MRAYEQAFLKDVAKLTPARSELVDAPYVQEFPLECKLIHTVKIGLHTLFVSEIVDVKVDETVLTENGRPVIDKVRPFVFSPGEQTYHAIGESVGPAFTMGKDLQPPVNGALPGNSAPRKQRHLL